MPPKPTIKLALPGEGDGGVNSPRTEKSVATVFQYAIGNLENCTSYEFVDEHKLTAGKFSSASFASFFIATLYKANAVEGVNFTLDQLCGLPYGIKHFIRPGGKTELSQLLRQRINKAFADQKWGSHLNKLVDRGTNKEGKVTYSLNWAEAEGQELAEGALVFASAALAEPPKPRFVIVGDRSAEAGAHDEASKKKADDEYKDALNERRDWFEFNSGDRESVCAAGRARNMLAGGESNVGKTLLLSKHLLTCQELFGDETTLMVFDKIQHSSALAKGIGRQATTQEERGANLALRDFGEQEGQDGLFEDMTAAVAFEEHDHVQFVHPRSCTSSSLGEVLSSMVSSADTYGARFVGDDQLLVKDVWVDSVTGSGGGWWAAGMLQQPSTIDTLKAGTVKDNISWTFTYHNWDQLNGANMEPVPRTHVLTLTVGPAGFTLGCARAAWGSDTRDAGSIYGALWQATLKWAKQNANLATAELNALFDSLSAFATVRDTIYIGMPLLGDKICPFGPETPGGIWRNVLLVRAVVAGNLKEECTARVKEENTAGNNNFVLNLLNEKTDTTVKKSQSEHGTGIDLFTPWMCNQTEKDLEEKKRKTEQANEKAKKKARLKTEAGAGGR